MGAGGLVAGGAVAGHVATALPSEASQALAREDSAYAPIAEGVQQVVWSVVTDEPAVALTFDDGPNAGIHPRVLDLLAAVGGRATFFMVGVQVEQERALVRRLVAEGHELGNHTWAHESPPCSPPSRPGTRSTAAPRRSHVSRGDCADAAAKDLREVPGVEERQGDDSGNLRIEVQPDGKCQAEEDPDDEHVQHDPTEELRIDEGQDAQRRKVRQAADHERAGREGFPRPPRRR